MPAKTTKALSPEVSANAFARLLDISAKTAVIVIGIFVAIVALQAGRAVLAPVALAIVVGLVLGPVADIMERRGIPSALSAGVMVLVLLGVLAGSILLFAVPLSEWVGRAPTIWQKFQAELVNWREPLQALETMQEQLKTALGGGTAMQVSVEDGSQVLDMAMIAPAILADVLVFLVSLYFFLATRDDIRISVMSVCLTRRMRWRTAHIFRDVEAKVSRFLLSVTLLNVGVGIAVALGTWALGLPSPLLWGALAAVLNYIPYVGQAVMLAILLAVGLATQAEPAQMLAPAGLYVLINLVEGQFLFPLLVGRSMTINPFLIFLSIVFWIWVWGPFGSLMAVPALIILQSVIHNIVPAVPVTPRRPVRRTAAMTDRDVILGNAARAIRDRAQAEEAAAINAAAASTKAKPPQEPVRAAPKRPRAKAKAVRPAAAT